MLKSRRYASDVRNVLAEQEFAVGEEATFLVTGATGLIGSAFVDALLGLNDFFGGRFTVRVAGRSVERLRARFGDRGDVVPVAYDAAGTNGFDFESDYVVHAASNASPDKYMAQPVETMVANFDGLRELLDYAHRVQARRLLYVSSSEVYGVKESSAPFGESDYGRVDILNVRSSYSEAKRAAETLAVSYAAEYGTDVAIARPGHVYGPTALPADGRISSLFARQAAVGEDLVMKSDGRTVRSYCHCLDCATALLTVLWRGVRGEAYNISNPGSVISIRQMAELMAKAGNVRLGFECPTESERKAFNPMDNASLDAERLLALGWKPFFGAEEGIAETIGALRDMEVAKGV